MLRNWSIQRQNLVKKILSVSYTNKEGHIPSSLSILDILHYLYWYRLTDDDQFVLSKGHGCLALYVTFLDKGIISEEEFFSFCREKSKLGGHPSSHKMPEILLSTGSLGHGLPFCVGLALAKKIKKEKGNVYCLIGDGEANEGTTWEAALIASTYGLDNLICMMDRNQSGDRAIKLGSCAGKFASFGWIPYMTNGNNLTEIHYTFHSLNSMNHPKFIQLRTIKGFGCPIMENNPEWHHKTPASQEELDQLLATVY